MPNLPAPTIDLIEDSRSHLLVIAFPRVNSSVYELAVNVAKTAAKYDALELGKSVMHLAAFAKTGADATRALALLRFVVGWKGVQICAGGKVLQTPYAAHEVVSCYVQSLACADWRAHCLYVINDPSSTLIKDGKLRIEIDIFSARPPPKQWLFPCKLLHPYFGFQLHHPATFIDQIQAEAISRGCDWCPNFSPQNFEEIIPLD